MLSFDTNVAVHALNPSSSSHEPCLRFVSSLAGRSDVAICELMLVELYLKLRNERIFPKPLSGEQAVAVCQQYRANRTWRLIDSAPVMDEVWMRARAAQFAFRRIIDLRLALTLRHHGVTSFATTNARDFRDAGFEELLNPVEVFV